MVGNTALSRRFRRGVKFGRKAKHSESFAFDGPRRQRTFRSRIRACDDISARSLGVARVVKVGWTRIVIMKAIWFFGGSQALLAVG
jgi:hypothetical protein